ncbi:hypothetical protein PPROV_000996900 [Pycnococcus provasolii]|uniref:Cleavage stimulation factor subunit 2 hinge domain-containing protein n=1 Tax=Pycnococcus provasolii TaxID=41880 RepID=A0A830HZH7_9CHLO|nr:hypothetical protein PPROV_000996900 [Pycnococcus provasolii]
MLRGGNPHASSMPPPTQPPMGMGIASQASSHANAMLGGQESGPGVGATDPLAQLLGGFSPNQLVEVLSQMKQLVQQNHTQARHILNNNPQLTKALFQAQIMLNMVHRGGPPAAPPPAAPGYPQHAPPPGYGAPPPPQQVAHAPQPQQLDSTHQQLLAQVLAMSPDQVNALPPDQRAQVLALQAQARQQQQPPGHV